MEPTDIELQKAQDMLTAVSRQREAAANECVHLAAALAAANRKIAELEKELEGKGEKAVSGKLNGKDEPMTLVS